MPVNQNQTAARATSWNPAEFAHWYHQADLEKRARAWNDLTFSQKQLFSEHDMFVRFARSAGIDYVPGTERTLDPNSCSPPPPDIVCEERSGTKFYELGEIVEEGLAAQAAKAEKERWHVYGGPVDIWRPLLRILSKKLRKRYFGAGPIDLILYYGIGRQAAFWPFVVPNIRERIQWLQARVNRGQFANVWVYDAHGDKLLARVSRRNPESLYLR
jgi:hypothetical protein